MAKKISPYFNDFITMMEHCCEAAELLLSSLKEFDPVTLPAKREEMHKIENAEDKLNHSIVERLIKEFLPPIDREDIIQLANEIDNVTDTIEDVLIRMDIYNIKKVHPAALEFADVIVRCCKSLHSAMIEFPNFQKSATVRQGIINVNHLEEECDAIYIKTMRELHNSSKDPMEIMVWSSLFEKMEECCDACEEVSDLMDVIVMKNS